MPGANEINRDVFEDEKNKQEKETSEDIKDNVQSKPHKSIFTKIKEVFKKGFEFIKNGAIGIGQAVSDIGVRILGGKDEYKAMIERRDEEIFHDASKKFIDAKVVCHDNGLNYEGTIKSYAENKDGRVYTVELCNGKTIQVPENNLMTMELFKLQNSRRPVDFQQDYISAEAYQKLQEDAEIASQGTEFEESEISNEEIDIMEDDKSDEDIPQDQEKEKHYALSLEEAANGDFMYFDTGSSVIEVQVIEFKESTAIIEHDGKQETVLSDYLYGTDDGVLGYDESPNQEVEDTVIDEPDEQDLPFVDYTEEDDEPEVYEENLYESENEQKVTTESNSQIDKGKAPEIEEPIAGIADSDKGPELVNIPGVGAAAHLGSHVLYQHKNNYQEAIVTAKNKKSMEIETLDGSTYTIKKSDIESSFLGYKQIEQSKTLRQLVLDENNKKISPDFRFSYKEALELDRASEDVVINPEKYPDSDLTVNFDNIKHVDVIEKGLVEDVENAETSFSLDKKDALDNLIKSSLEQSAKNMKIDESQKQSLFQRIQDAIKASPKEDPIEEVPNQQPDEFKINFNNIEHIDVIEEELTDDLDSLDDDLFDESSVQIESLEDIKRQAIEEAKNQSNTDYINISEMSHDEI